MCVVQRRWGPQHFEEGGWTRGEMRWMEEGDSPEREQTDDGQVILRRTQSLSI